MICNHKWEMYQGFTDSFEHCASCGMKKKDWKEPSPQLPVDVGFEREFLAAGGRWGYTVKGGGGMQSRQGYKTAQQQPGNPPSLSAEDSLDSLRYVKPQGLAAWLPTEEETEAFWSGDSDFWKDEEDED